MSDIFRSIAARRFADAVQRLVKGGDDQHRLADDQMHKPVGDTYGLRDSTRVLSGMENLWGERKEDTAARARHDRTIPQLT